MRDNGKGVSIRSGPGSPRGQPAWGGGCDRVSRLERNRPGCRVALTTLVQARALALQSPVASAPGTHFISRYLLVTSPHPFPQSLSACDLCLERLLIRLRRQAI